MREEGDKRSLLVCSCKDAFFWLFEKMEDEVDRELGIGSI